MKVSFNIPLSIVSFGVFFPLAFVISVVYQRRDSAALVIASIKASATGAFTFNVFRTGEIRSVLIFSTEDHSRRRDVQV
jgi:hypothetical protein